jgi:endonuclease YncB( thermonuclease family)
MLDAILVVGMVRAQSLDPSDVRVIDGDTIAVHSLHDPVRLVGRNAPETHDRMLGRTGARR